MNKTYLVANWKSNKNQTEARSWVKKVNQSLPKTSSQLKLVLCAPFIHLDFLDQQLSSHQLGVQNLSPYSDGAYTGEVSARMLEGLASYALLGHSERRQYFHENHQQVALKATQALEYHITPIIALDPDTWHQQLNQFNTNQKKLCIFMYEPPEAISQQVGAIGVGQAAPIASVIKAITEIKKHVPQSPVLYGGSVKNTNIAKFLKPDIIDGVVPGSASQDASQWLKIINIANKHRG